MKISDILDQMHTWKYDYNFIGDPSTEIVGFSDPQNYHLGTAIWIGKLGDIKLKNDILYGDISLCITSNKSSEIEQSLSNIIYCESPKTVFAKLVTEYYPKEYVEYKDPTASISKNAKIGKYCYIGRNVCIEKGAQIGNYCEIYDNTYIGRDCFIGNNCSIGQNCVIGGETNGSAFIDVDGILKNMPNTGSVRIGNYVQIGAGCIIAKGTFFETVIGDECMVNAGCSIGHNCDIGRRVYLLGRCTINGNTTIGEGSQLISAIVKNRICIGKNVKVGIGSVVIKDMPNDITCFGNPARIISDTYITENL